MGHRDGTLHLQIGSCGKTRYDFDPWQLEMCNRFLYFPASMTTLFQSLSTHEKDRRAATLFFLGHFPKALSFGPKGSSIETHFS